MSNDTITTLWSLAIVGVILLVIAAGRWYWAGVQSDVYNRQGAPMSRWEVFIGAKPAKVVTP